MSLDHAALTGLDVVTPNDTPSESWANGLGVTRVLAKRLGWRLSIAELRGRMPFSQLPGIDRVLIPLNRQTVGLTIDGVEQQVTRTDGIRFPGEARVVGTADRSGTSVVNLMVHRGLAAGVWTISSARGAVPVDPSTTATVLLSGVATLDDLPLPQGSAVLQSHRARTIVTDAALIARFAITPV